VRVSPGKSYAASPVPSLDVWLVAHAIIYPAGAFLPKVGAIRVGVLLPVLPVLPVYPFTLLPFYPSGKAPYPLWLLRDWLLSTFGETERAAVSAYRRFVEDGIGQSRAW